MKKWIALCCALFWAPHLWADAGATTFSGLTMESMFTPPATDLSVSLLGQLFGSVGGVLPGSSGQIMGQLFKALNYGMVMLAGAVVTYTVVMSVVNTAQDGQFMGQQRNTAWTVLRTVGGISMLVPKATGYSFIQVFIMWAVVQGIGLADTLWSQALQYLGHGSLVSSGPGSMNSNMTTMIPYSIDLLESQICLQGLIKLTNDARNQGTQVPVYSWGTSYSNGTISFGATNTSNSDYATLKNVCGEMNFNGVINNSTDPEYTTALQTAAIDMATTLASVGVLYNQTYAQGSTPTENTGAVIRSIASTGVVSAAANFINAMTPTMQAQSTSCNHSSTDNFMSGAQSQGWITAGGYYYNLAQIANNCDPTLSSGALTQTTAPSLSGTALFLLKNQLNNASALDYLSNTLIDMPSSTGASGNTSSQCGNNPLNSSQGMCIGVLSRAVWAQIMSASGTQGGYTYSGNWQNSAQIGSAMAGTAVAAFLGAGPVGGLVVTIILSSLGALLVQFQDDFTDPNMPLQNVAKLGNQMISAALAIWIASTAVMFITAAVMSIMNSMTGMGAAVISSAMTMVPVMTSVVVALIVNGVMLAVYVPLIPFLIYFFTTIGWIMSVVEAMVAGPLVALGVTHPEGHDLLGKSEQSLMLLLSVFMKPVAMIIAFFAAMILAKIGVQLLNIGFATIVNKLGTGMFQALGLILVYTMALIRVVNMCFSVVYLLPDRVMRWIGVSPDSIDVESHLRMIKSGLREAAQTGADTSVRMTTGSKETMGWTSEAFGKIGNKGAKGKKSGGTK